MTRNGVLAFYFPRVEVTSCAWAEIERFDWPVVSSSGVFRMMCGVRCRHIKAPCISFVVLHDYSFVCGSKCF